jgi:DNA (cytosine-5)-methyltransferase 1
MKLLDLYCGAGGAAMGYYKAGFEIFGVDNKVQKNYPFPKMRADVLAILEGLADRGENGFFGRPDVIHASPPCQAYSTTKGLHEKKYPTLIEPTRELLRKIGLPYVIENVSGAPLVNPVCLCGSAFGLGVWRHRYFESNVFLWGAQCMHFKCKKPIDVTGTGGPCKTRTTAGGGIHRKPKNMKQAYEVMGIDWMTRKEINQAIPPAYAEYIGKQLIQRLKAPN